MEKYIILILSYVIGSIPFSLIIAKINGINLREVGSGNIGATNVARTGNKRLAVLALFLDSLKGFVAVYTAQQFCDNNDFYIYVSAILAVLGHMFPIWLRFNGGKGVATTLGVLIALNISIALAFVFVWLIVFFIFRYSSLASLAATAAAVIASFFFQKELFLILLTVAILIFLKHYKNIANLLQGRERKFL
ncbi:MULTISPECIES: glycerol-3-phosphate 1-O-acyltransferase PlsY [Wolbachia]|uniref:Glycerol-3-phosphate acyltransferase n=1 Tax=Wolbachia endosymbiont of Ephestia elutella TaxID=3231696 RepID=A0AAU8MKD6_9RICK|nr:MULTISPECIES: glycerol-3-phosphate 1-O-acyltransferase PlsY [Wolbachia]MBS9531652.1 glycerol-3-phosphate acyltransferase [Wolbachia endosymbiont of Rhagoletis cerasi]OAB81662.1 acyl-phosphate glycerol 3-phosphate acyltransferase [Wolbachia endosymbiont of Laodelphax striatellus]PBQ26538.1 acyl-phosphate glycerol 3-phosphate acyltransferase [Wolbachia pipientis wAus]UFO00240.1 glycerol-3-phosphate 1-O-acyltransferase PlsY [Wolbachia endosymbiont of Corcyra cephalonica]UXX39759.1 glycerol-3-p